MRSLWVRIDSQSVLPLARQRNQVCTLAELMRVTPPLLTSQIEDSGFKRFGNEKASFRAKRPDLRLHR